MRRELLIGLVLVALTLGVYLPVRTHDFIFYDDPQFITDNPQIRSGLSWSTARYAFTQPVVGNWHPVTTLSHALDCELFGVSPGAHHLVNVLIHCLNTVLLFLVLNHFVRRGYFCGFSTTAARASLHQDQITGDPPNTRAGTWLSALVALIFAWHPLRVESVAWIAERKDLLSALFFLLSIALYARYVEKSDTRVFGTGGQGEAQRGSTRLNTSRAGLAAYMAALLCFAFGLMSKPMVVTLPFVLLLLDFWPLRRFELGNFRSQLPGIRRLVLEKIPFFLLSALDSLITLRVQASAGAFQVIENISWADRMANAATSYMRYLGKFFWPSNLAIVYPHPAKHYFLNETWPGWEIGCAGLVLALITILSFVQARKRPYLLFGWLWFLGTLVPVIGLVQVGEQAMADRYTYIALIGPAISLISLVAEAVTLSRWPKTAARSSALAGVLVLASLVLLTRQQLAYWRDTTTLFEHALAVTADNPSAQFALGVGLENQGDVRKAMVHYRVAISIDPHYGKAYYNMGQVFRKQALWREAADAYLAATRTMPNDLPTQLNLASVLPHLGRTSEAITHFNHALELDPNSIEALNNLAWLLSTCPEPQTRSGTRAVELAEHGCALTSSRAPFLLGTLAAAYAEAGRFGDAVLAGEQASARATELGDLALAARNRELVEVYRASKPYHEEWK
jgi:Tfp pilus assembly protein PilF